MKPPHLALPVDCLLHIVQLAASLEPGAAAGGDAGAAAADAGAYLHDLLAVGGVCRDWRAATLGAAFDADISWAQLRRFAAQVLGTDARATALRRLAVSGAVPLASQVAGAMGVNSFANLGWAQGSEAQQEVYRSLWRELGLHRIQGTIAELWLQTGKPPRGDFDVTPSILLHSLHMALAGEDGEPWPHLERLTVSCPFVREEIGSRLVAALPALQSLQWAELQGTEQAWAAIAAATNLHSQLTQLCLGIAFDGDEFQMPSLAALTRLEELVVAYTDDFTSNREDGLGSLLLPPGQWLPPSLRHLRLPGAKVELPSGQGALARSSAHLLSLAGLESSLQTLMTVRDAPSSGPSRTLSNLLEGLPTLPVLRALGIVIAGTSLFSIWPDPGLRAPDLLNKLPALTHLFIPPHAIHEPSFGSRYRFVLEPSSKQQLSAELAALARCHIRLFIVDYNMPEMMLPWMAMEGWAGMGRPSNAMRIVAGGRDVTSTFQVALLGGSAVEREPAACVSRLVRMYERAAEFAREQGWAVLADE